MFSNATAILWVSFWEDFLQTQSMGETLFSLQLRVLFETLLLGFETNFMCQ